MCRIAAIINYRRDIKSEVSRISSMCNALNCNGLYEEKVHCSHNYLLAHTKSNRMNENSEGKSFHVEWKGVQYSIVLDGAIYNYKEIRNELLQLGYSFMSDCDTEVVLYAFIEWKESCLNKFNGVFAFIIVYDDEAFIVRDPFGVKPLFYSYKNDGEWLIASEIKAILSEGSIRPIFTKHSFATMISLGPSLPIGTTLYKNIFQLKAGHYLKIKKYNHTIVEYHKIKCYQHIDTKEDTIHRIYEMVKNCIKRQCMDDIEICGMLSGGLDSSIICGVASQQSRLKTYSLQFNDNAKYFNSNSFQPTLDHEYAELMAKQINSKHEFIEISQVDIANSLEEAMIARDMPAMADIDSSLLLFCKKLSKSNKIVLTGECGDEVFGGYPWFYKEELSNRDTFPWLNYLPNKIELVNDQFRALDYYGIRKNVYDSECNRVSYLESDSLEDRISKKMTHLSIYYFMQTLLMRMDAIASATGIEGRVPFADKNIIDYVYNIPWSMKYYNNQEKMLLREAFKKDLPSSIIERKKSPFPKTYNPEYTELVCGLLEKELSTNEYMKYYFDEKVVKELIDSRASNFELPWFGQLMKGPQLLAYLYQFSKWTTNYQIIPE